VSLSFLTAPPLLNTDQFVRNTVLLHTRILNRKKRARTSCYPLRGFFFHSTSPSERHGFAGFRFSAFVDTNELKVYSVETIILDQAVKILYMAFLFFLILPTRELCSESFFLELRR